MSEINQMAAIALRSALDAAIKSLEDCIQLKIEHKDEAVMEYFSCQRKERLAAIGQLKALRADAHKQAFEAYRRELSA